jgi:hypothetical protein
MDEGKTAQSDTHLSLPPCVTLCTSLQSPREPWRKVEVQAQGWTGALSHFPATFHPSLPQGPAWPGFFAVAILG